MKSVRGATALPVASILFMTVFFSSAVQLGCGGDEELPSPDLTRERAERPASTGEPDAGAKTGSAGQKQERGSSAGRGDAPAGDPAPLLRELEETVDVGDLYPEDGPLYPGVKPSKLSQSQDGKVTIMMGTEAAPGEAVDVMSAAAESKGWNILSHQVMDDAGSLILAEKDGRQLRMLVSPLESQTSGKKTLVAVSVDP